MAASAAMAVTEALEAPSVVAVSAEVVVSVVVEADLARGGGGGGGRGNFRNFNPGQPHGSIAWNGTNSIFNALPFSLQGQPQVQPSNGTNRFTLSFMSAPYIPHLTKPRRQRHGLPYALRHTPIHPRRFLRQRSHQRGAVRRFFRSSGLPTIYDPTTSPPTQFLASNT